MSAAFAPASVASRTPTQQVWNREDLEARQTWRYSLDDAVVREYRAWCNSHPVAPEDFASFELSRFTLPLMWDLAQRIRTTLLNEDGVAWIRGLKDFHLTAHQTRLFFVVLGRTLGTPLTSYGLLYPVRDTGVDYRTSAVPVSKTNAETQFHTDSSSATLNPDFVGLLCETPSLNGGDSMLSNALLAHRKMQQWNPEALDILEKESFIRDIVTPGKENELENLKKNRIPVFAPSLCREGLEFRYMRYWIEKGQRRANLALSSPQLAALDCLDAWLTHPEHVVRFKLDKDEMLWVNNRILAHNRSAYLDSPGNVRQCQRMWVQAS